MALQPHSIAALVESYYPDTRRCVTKQPGHL